MVTGSSTGPGEAAMVRAHLGSLCRIGAIEEIGIARLENCVKELLALFTPPCTVAKPDSSRRNSSDADDIDPGKPPLLSRGK